MSVDLTPTQLTLAELYEINLQNGLNAYFTSHDQNISWDSKTWQAIPIGRGPIGYHSNLQVDKVDISMGLVGVTVGTEAYTIPQIIRRDYLRNAHVTIRVVDYVALADANVLFEGYATGGASFNAGVLSLSVGSLLDKLNEKFPKVIYSEFCPHVLFSTHCGLASTSYEVTGTASTASDQTNIYSTVFNFSTSYPNGYWVRGRIKMTSGDNDTVERTIQEHSDGAVKLLIQFPETSVAANTFSVWPGCDRSGQTCDEKFDNYANFLGFEYIPKPETVLY